MGRLVLMTLGFAIGVTAAVLVSAYSVRGVASGTTERRP
jgi:hypothetical protein